MKMREILIFPTNTALQMYKILLKFHVHKCFAAIDTFFVIDNIFYIDRLNIIWTPLKKKVKHLKRIK